MPQKNDSDPSDSAVQREIELVMLYRLSKVHENWEKIEWKPFVMELGLSSIWQKVKPDAIWRTNTQEIIIAECYARVGELKAGHRRKMAMDALKLLALRDALKGKNVRCLLVVPEELKKHMSNASWFPVALHLVAEIVTVKLQKDEFNALIVASTGQATGQARTKRALKDGIE
jgi:hypothetical protein